MAEAGSVAEEVISTIRTAKAFGSQAKLSEQYNTHVHKARGADLRKSFWLGGSLAVLFFVLYGAYGLGMSYPSDLTELMLTCSQPSPSAAGSSTRDMVNIKRLTSLGMY
jgi:hypothetical protein